MIRDSPYNSVFSRLSKRPPSPPPPPPSPRCDVAAVTCGDPSMAEEYALQLAANKTTLFALSIDNFVQSTIESEETDPFVVMRNVRQFMSGMINYLTINYKDKFQRMAEMKRRQLVSTEFVNLDEVLENVVNKLILKELRVHIYSLLVNKYVDDGSIQSMAENIHYAIAKSLSIQDYAARRTLIPPKENDLKKISECFKCLQLAFLPSEKLEHLLSAVTLIKDSVNMRYRKIDISIGGDDFLPLMIWVLVQCNVYTAELEVEYMCGLLPPSRLNTGEGGYYLTTLSSAMNVLKSYKSSTETSTMENGVKTILNFPDTLSYDPLNELESVIKIVIFNEPCGSYLTKMLPVRSHMTVHDVRKIIARKLRVINPGDYYLFELIDRQERFLDETERPQAIKSSAISRGCHCLFVYKKIDEN